MLIFFFEMEFIILVVLYDFDLGRVLKVVVIYDVFLDIVEKQFVVLLIVKVIFLSFEDDVFELENK